MTFHEGARSKPRDLPRHLVHPPRHLAPAPELRLSQVEESSGPPVERLTCPDIRRTRRSDPGTDRIGRDRPRDRPDASPAEFKVRSVGETQEPLHLPPREDDRRVVAGMPSNLTTDASNLGTLRPTTRRQEDRDHTVSRPPGDGGDVVLSELTRPNRPWTHLVLNEDEQSGQLHEHVRPLPASEVWLDLVLGAAASAPSPPLIRRTKAALNP